MKREDIHKVLIIGSGPIIIGQACEFDYSGTQACKALKKLGYEIVLVNSNPATIMTDPDTADITYIEPLNVQRLEQIIDKERPDALLPNLGGQSGLNLCSELSKAGVLDKYNVKVIGVQVDGYSECTLSVTGYPYLGSYSLSSGTFSIESPTATLASPSSSLLVFPGSIKDYKALVTCGGEEFSYYFPEQELEGGKEYRYRLKVSREGKLELEGITVTAWQDGGEYEIPVRPE